MRKVLFAISTILMIVCWQCAIGENTRNKTKKNKSQVEQERRRVVIQNALDEILSTDVYGSVSYDLDKNYYSSLLDRLDGVADNKVDYLNSAIFFRDNIAGLDKNGDISIESVENIDDLSKEQIYVRANHWFLNNFVSAKSVIQLNDKELGVILAKGFLENIALNAAESISAYILFRIDIKDGKVRIITTIQEYEVDDSFSGIYIKTRPQTEFPFLSGMANGELLSKSGAKAYCASCLCMIALKNKLVKAIKQGVVDAETEDWL